jgi:glycosyltransferase involved in cell wall biosynthesis
MIIAHIIWSMNSGGSENLLIDELANFPNCHNLHLFVVNKGPNVLLTNVPVNVKVHCIGRIPGAGFLPPITAVAKLTHALRQEHPDVLVCHQVNLVRLLRFVKGRRIARVHNVQTSVNNDANAFDQIVAISAAVAEYVREQTPLTSPVVVYNGIPVSEFSKRTSWDCPAKFRLLQVGRLDHQIKGQDLSLRALRICNERNSSFDWHIDFIGDGQSMNVLVKLSQKLDIEERVSFLGTRPRQYIKEHLKDYHILLQPSRFEGFGLTVAEAMAAKVPVLVSNIDGPAEITDNGRYGFTFRSEDVEDYAKMIMEVFNAYERAALAMMVNAAYTRVCRFFDINIMVRNLEKIYLNS